MLRTIAVLIVLLGLTSAHWEAYKKVYGKNHDHDEEHFRRELFNKNVARISAHNLRHDLGLTTYRMGLNQFTDMTNEEFKAHMGLEFNASNAVRTVQRFEHKQTGYNLPTTVDWRTKGYVTPVKNQGKCGSCWAFAVTGALEGQQFKATGKLVSLSVQNLVDCAGAHLNEGCRGGRANRAFSYIRFNEGIATEESYPYTAKDGTCKYNASTVGARVTDYFQLPESDEKALQKAVATIGPISVAIDGSNESFKLYKEGIYDEPKCSPRRPSHALLVVGYGTENGVDYWLLKNSWGTNWGMNGYIKMIRNENNQCGIASEAYYPIVGRRRRPRPETKETL